VPLRWPSCGNYSASSPLPSKQRVAGSNPAGRAHRKSRPATILVCPVRALTMLSAAVVPVAWPMTPAATGPARRPPSCSARPLWPVAARHCRADTGWPPSQHPLTNPAHRHRGHWRYHVRRGPSSSAFHCPGHGRSPRAPSASLRDRLRRPLTRRPLPRDSAPIEEDGSRLGQIGPWSVQRCQVSIGFCHSRK
jgi:hypothetical protein